MKHKQTLGDAWVPWIIIQRTAGVIWDSPDVHEQLISLNAEYDAWINVNYHFWIRLAIIFFNNVFFVSLHQGTKGIGEWFKHKRRYAKTITPLSNQSNLVSMSSTPSLISLGLMTTGTHNWSTAQKSGMRSLYLLNIGTWQGDEIEFQCCLARFVISNKGVMRCQLASNQHGHLKGNDYADGEGEQPPGKEECQMGSPMWKSGVHRRWWRSAVWMGAPNLSWWAVTGIEECPYTRRSPENVGG